ncbi:hypothetical protein NJF54_19850 [Pseudomonas guariconensis]|uniref:hypothetical protein n=1 Tax=Pseudomonas guariconensis TaxID=1288410 RepID=UPI00209B4177|nr:hypothetical protein [Pseudomonas guariconensis]MCO7634078.1 hypothetical protein [Pseudomonas guariconensis]
MNDIALWLGYGVMACAGLALLALVLFVLSYACVAIVNKWIKAMMRAYDLNILRQTMRQLEAEGKVSKKTGVHP